MCTLNIKSFKLFVLLIITTSFCKSQSSGFLRFEPRSFPVLPGPGPLRLRGAHGPGRGRHGAGQRLDRGAEAGHRLGGGGPGGGLGRGHQEGPRAEMWRGWPAEWPQQTKEVIGGHI